MNGVADKVRKLLRLSQSPNVHEAAEAAAKAQSLIDQYNLTATMLSLETDTPRADEPVGDWAEPLDRGTGKLAMWRWTLAASIMRLNGCSGYVSGGAIKIIGRATDVEAVRYLYPYLRDEVERLAHANARGNGRTYANNYRLGVVDTIRQRLAAERKRVLDEARAASTGTALIRLSQAVAIMDSRHAEAERWGKVHLHLRSSGGGTSAYDHNARERGRKDGQSITINAARGSVGPGRKSLSA